MAGKVRRCHGDLHLRNICLLDGKPVLFDCIEFSDEIASIDVLYDLAFLLMDLEHRNLQDLANQGLNRYLDLTDEDAGLAALPLFVSLRAAVRAHVTAAAASSIGSPDEFERKREEARRYLDLALTVLEPQLPRLIAIGGLSGAGKSTIAQALAPTFGTRPGARVLRSDVIRKRLWGVMPESRLPSRPMNPMCRDAFTIQSATRRQSRSVPAILRSLMRCRCPRRSERLLPLWLRQQGHPSQAFGLMLRPRRWLRACRLAGAMLQMLLPKSSGTSWNATLAASTGRA